MDIAIIFGNQHISSGVCLALFSKQRQGIKYYCLQNFQGALFEKEFGILHFVMIEQLGTLIFVMIEKSVRYC